MRPVFPILCHCLTPICHFIAALHLPPPLYSTNYRSKYTPFCLFPFFYLSSHRTVIQLCNTTQILYLQFYFLGVFPRIFPVLCDDVSLLYFVCLFIFLVVVVIILVFICNINIHVKISQAKSTCFVLMLLFLCSCSSCVVLSKISYD